MDYFILEQDKRYINTPFILNLGKTIDKRKINRENSSDIKDIMVLFVDGKRKIEYTDILDRQLFLITEEIMELFSKYEPETIFKTISLIDVEREHQEIYYLPIFEEVDCISPNSEFNMDKSIIRKLIIEKDKIGDRKIFKLAHKEKTTILVRLDAAESLLRRNVKGIKLTRVKGE